MKNVVTPWSEESRRILDNLVQNGKGWSEKSKVAIEFGKKYPYLIDNNFLDIGWIRKKNKRMFVTYPNVRVNPISPRSSRHLNKKYHFLKIF